MDEFALHDAFAVASPGGQKLGACELHVWAVPLTGDPEQLGAHLSKAENQRLSRFHFADHRRRYQIGHGALRAILAGYLGCGPADVEFASGPRGKPYLAGPGPHFNLSHSGKLALIGIANFELGLDLEKVRRLDSLTEIARKHFSASEFAALDALQGDARELAFYRCWTRKEAYIKAVGEGLSMPLDIFDVSLDEQPRFLATDFVAAAAMRQHGVRVQRHRLAGS
jgi:4'-phosphopantetheinyl transferase